MTESADNPGGVVSQVRVVTAGGLADRVRAAVQTNAAGILDTLAGLLGNARNIDQLPDGSWPTVTRNPRLAYRWCAKHDPARLPTTEDGALPGDEFVGATDAFLPGETVTTPETRTAALRETFAGVLDGATWPNTRWVTAHNPTGGAVTVTDEVGVLTTGKTGNYDSADTANVRTVTAWRDFEVEFTFTLPNLPDAEVRWVARADKDTLDPANGVVIAFTPTTVKAAHVLDWAYRVDASTTTTHSPGVRYRARIIIATQTSGDTLLRARSWATDGTEPSQWTIDTTLDTIPTAAGFTGMSVPGVGDAVASTVHVDDVTVYTRPAASNPEWWGTWAA